MSKNDFVLIRGGGDLASGVALRLHRIGVRTLIAELPRPLAVRRTVSFAEAVYEGTWEVEGVKARLIEADQLSAWDEADEIPVIVDPDADILLSTLREIQGIAFHPSTALRASFPVVVDARLLKTPPHPLPAPVPLHIGLGPGFSAGRDCHAVIETRRSHTLGRVYWRGSTQPDSREPEGDPRRVLRAPADGVVVGMKKIGEHVEEGEAVAVINQLSVISERSSVSSGRYSVVSPFKGVLRGLIRDGLRVPKGMKIGDIDPRDDPSYCWLVSDKALAIGGGALEAILSRREIRKALLP